MFKSLMAWGMKLLQSLAVWAQILRYFFPDGSRVKSAREGYVSSACFFMDAACCVNVCDGEERDLNDFLCCPHYPL